MTTFHPYLDLVPPTVSDLSPLIFSCLPPPWGVNDFFLPHGGGRQASDEGGQVKILVSPHIHVCHPHHASLLPPHQMGEEKTFPPPSVSVPCDFHPLKWLDAMRFLTHFFSPIGAFCLSPPTVGGGE